jgi:hypothetical protein
MHSLCDNRWQPSPGRVDRQEIVYWDEDIRSPSTGERVGAYVLGTKSDLQNDVAKAPLMTRLFISFDDPYLLLPPPPSSSSSSHVFLCFSLKSTIGIQICSALSMSQMASVSRRFFIHFLG